MHGRSIILKATSYINDAIIDIRQTIFNQLHIMASYVDIILSMP